jgi:predicted chitinase
MALKYNVNNVINLYSAKGGKTLFPKSLRDILVFAQNDDKISNIKELAYLLATAKVESDYSLTRWESDYLCGTIGEPYRSQPCQKAIDYYRSSSGKKNYFTLGTDSRNLPYFGRGLIQLTGKSNYEKYGKLAGLGNALVENGDLALEPRNSFKIAVAYLDNRTFNYVNKNDLRNARISVNGGVKGLDKTNEEYNRWLTILKNPKINVKSSTFNKNVILFSLVGFSLISVGFYLIYKGVKK